MSSKFVRSVLLGVVISRVKFCMISASEKRNPGAQMSRVTRARGEGGNVGEQHRRVVEISRFVLKTVLIQSVS